MASLEEMQQALADQIELHLAGTAAADPVENLQVHGLMNFNPSPPSIDVYPAEEFQEPFTYGGGNVILYLIVRARVTTADPNGGQSLLLSMMDPAGSRSVTLAVGEDRTLGGKVGKATVVEGPSGFGEFPGATNDGGRLLGCIWRVQVVPT